MNINIAVLTRKQIKNKACILSTSRNETAQNTSAHRGSQIGNSLKEFIENNLLNAPSFPKQTIREIFNFISFYEKSADIIAILLFNL
jgi:hypothetical protein